MGLHRLKAGKGSFSLSMLLVLAGIYFSPAAVAGAPGPERVLVIYNASYTGDEDGDGVQDSLQVAQYYARKHGVPAQNLLGLACSTDAGYSSDATGYSNFLNQVVLPVRSKLTQLGADNIDILLFSFHMPYLAPGDIVNGAHSLDNAMMNLWNLSTATGATVAAQVQNPYLNTHPTFGTDHGNFNHGLYRYSGNNIYLTSRLDGPLGLFGAMAQVDAASNGTRYICLLPGYYYAYDLADMNIAYTEHFITAAGMSLKWENTDKVLGQSTGLRYQDGTVALTAPKTLLDAGLQHRRWRHHHGGQSRFGHGRFQHDADDSRTRHAGLCWRSPHRQQGDVDA